VDKIIQYRSYIQALLVEYSQYRPSYGKVEVEQISDTVNDHYQLGTVGWDEQERIYGCLFHIDIKDGKCWVKHDGTEDGIANRLVAQGVPKTDIVLGKRIFLMIPLRASCHPERSEGSARRPGEMLRYAQHDMVLGHFKISASLLQRDFFSSCGHRKAQKNTENYISVRFCGLLWRNLVVVLGLASSRHLQHR